MRRSVPLLSKSRYLAGLQCAKRLYLECHRFELAGESGAAQQRLFAQGHEVGRLATLRYPSGVLVDDDPRRHERAVETTAAAMRAGAPAIFEAAFAHDGVRIRVDILVRRRQGGWRVEEVKSTKSVKDIHVHDLAVQLHVLDGCGLDVREAGITHLDGDYVRATPELAVDELFVYEDLLTEARAAQHDVGPHLVRWRRLLALPAPPGVAPGSQCKKPYDCPFLALCNPAPGKYSLHRLPAGERLARTLGDTVRDDVRRLPASARLSELQARAVACLRRGVDHVAPGLRKRLAAVRWPLHFLDFETFAPAVPRYLGTCVYQTLPFQWSDHVLDRHGTLGHREYLHAEDTDPRRAVLDSLLDALGDDDGSVVVYSSYEAQQLRALAEAFPRKARRIGRVLERLVDLLPVVREHYYHPALDGSFSLKRVVPVLVPDLAWGDLADGAEASAAYEELIDPATPTSRRTEIDDALRAYCGTDTLALVKVREALLARAARPECARGT